MKNVQKIGAGQFMTVLICTRVVVSLTYSFDIMGQNLSNSEWFCALCMIPIMLIMAVPGFILYRRTGLSAVDSAYSLARPVGHVTGVLFALFFLSSTVTYVSRFNLFITSTMQTDQAPFFYPLVLIIPMCYAAIRGIEALSRAASIISIMGLLSIIVIILSVIGRFDSARILSPFYFGVGKLTGPLAVFTSNTTEAIVLMLMLPRVSGKQGAAYAGFAIAAPIIMSAIFFTVTSVFGSFASYQNFPFYSVAGIAEIGELKQLSVLHASNWLLGLFVKGSLFLYLTFDCVESIIPERRRSLTIILCGAVVLVGSSLITAELITAIKIFVTKIWLYSVLFFSIVVPLILLLLLALKNRKKHLPNRSGMAVEGGGAL